MEELSAVQKIRLECARIAAGVCELPGEILAFAARLADWVLSGQQNLQDKTETRESDYPFSTREDGDS